MSEFTLSTALSISTSSEDFPVNFDAAWRWIGYKAKRNAKEVLMNNFEEGVDFLRLTTKSPTGGRPSESIMLTKNTFKELSMIAGTDKGKEIRRYFLNCEKQLKQVSTRLEAQIAAMAITFENQFAAITDRLAAIEAKLDQPQSPKLAPKLKALPERTELQIAQERQEIYELMGRYKR